MPTQEKNNANETAATNSVNKSIKPKPKGKKPPQDNVKDGGSNVESKPLDGAGSPISTGNKISPTDWFTSEIQDMMYGFGDSSSPLVESAQLIEEIVRQQMTSLLFQAADVSVMRNSKVIGPEDIIFLLRKDKVKLRRLVKYLEVKDMKGSSLRSASIDEEDVESLADNKLSMSKSKRFKMCQDFVASFDTTGELLSLFEEEVLDDIKFERDQRLEQKTRCMDQQQYLEFSKARQASFAKKFRSTKFRDWLLKDLTDLKTTASAVEIFNYMAYETVAQIIDLALIIKKECREEGGDEISRLSTGIYYNPEFPSVHLTNYIPNKPAGPHRPDSPGQTPISPPLSPVAGSVTQGMNPGPGCSKMKAKKRRKSETRSSCDNTSGCIEPWTIREAISRYFRQVGPFSLFSKSQHSILSTRLMCC